MKADNTTILIGALLIWQFYATVLVALSQDAPHDSAICRSANQGSIQICLGRSQRGACPQYARFEYRDSLPTKRKPLGNKPGPLLSRLRRRVLRPRGFRLRPRRAHFRLGFTHRLARDRAT